MDNQADKEEAEIKKMEESLFSDISHPKIEEKPVSKEEERKKEIGEEIGLIKHVERKKEKTTSFSDEKHVTLKFNPKKAKTVLLIAVILALLTFSFVYNPFYNMLPWMGGNNSEGNEITSSIVAEFEEEIEINETIEEEEEELNETIEEEEIEINETEEEEETLSLSGEITVTIDDYTTEISEVSGTGKVTSVSVTIDNGLELFIPKIKIWIYDEETKDTYQLPSVAIVEKFDEDLSPGQLLKATIETKKFLFSSDNLDEEKTIMIKVYDEGDKKGTAKDRLLARTDKEVKIN